MTEAEKQYINNVMKATAEALDITVNQLTSSRKLMPMVKSRFIGWMMIRREYPALPYHKIGEAYGGRTHATVIHGIREGKMAVFGDGKLPPLQEWVEDYSRAQRRLMEITEQ